VSPGIVGEVPEGMNRIRGSGQEERMKQDCYLVVMKWKQGQQGEVPGQERERGDGPTTTRVTVQYCTVQNIVKSEADS